MKNIFLLALLLGLTGCGNDSQNGASQVDSSHGLGGQTVAKTMSASSLALGGWTVTNSSAVGASTLLDAAKDTRISTALITPNATDVAKILRGGAAGIALSLAVDQILGAVDWVLDPANNQIKYFPDDPVNPPNIPYYYKITGGFSSGTQVYSDSKNQLCNKTLYKLNSLNNGYVYSFTGISGDSVGYCNFNMQNVYSGNMSTGGMPYGRQVNPNYDPDVERKYKTLPLEIVAEQVIDNADNDNTDAQVATNAAAQAILAEAYNDATKALPIVTELENNAENKCDSSDVNCYPECEPPAGVKFNKVTHYERHGRNPDPNVGSHGCMAKTGSPVHWHYDVNDQLPDGRCITRKHIFGGCGVAP